MQKLDLSHARANVLFLDHYLVRGMEGAGGGEVCSHMCVCVFEFRS